MNSKQMLSKEQAQRNLARLLTGIEGDPNNKMADKSNLSMEKAEDYMDFVREMGKKINEKGYNVLKAEQGYYLETPDGIMFGLDPAGIISIDDKKSIYDLEKDMEELSVIEKINGETIKNKFARYKTDFNSEMLIVKQETSNYLARGLTKMFENREYEKLTEKINSTRIL